MLRNECNQAHSEMLKQSQAKTEPRLTEGGLPKLGFDCTKVKLY